MSVTPIEPPARRVRHQARDVVALMLFSLAVSIAVAAALALVATISLTAGS